MSNQDQNNGGGGVGGCGVAQPAWNPAYNACAGTWFGNPYGWGWGCGAGPFGGCGTGTGPGFPYAPGAIGFAGRFGIGGGWIGRSLPKGYAGAAALGRGGAAGAAMLCGGGGGGGAAGNCSDAEVGGGAGAGGGMVGFDVRVNVAPGYSVEMRPYREGENVFLAFRGETPTGPVENVTRVNAAEFDNAIKMGKARFGPTLKSWFEKVVTAMRGMPILSNVNEPSGPSESQDPNIPALESANPDPFSNMASAAGANGGGVGQWPTYGWPTYPIVVRRLPLTYVRPWRPAWLRPTMLPWRPTWSASPWWMYGNWTGNSFPGRWWAGAAGGAVGGCGDDWQGGAAGQMAYVRPGFPVARLAITATTADIEGPRVESIRRCAVNYITQSNKPRLGGYMLGGSLSPSGGYSFRGPAGEMRAYLVCAIQEAQRERKPSSRAIFLPSALELDSSAIMAAYQKAIDVVVWPASMSGLAVQTLRAQTAWRVVSALFGEVALPAFLLPSPTFTDSRGGVWKVDSTPSTAGTLWTGTLLTSPVGSPAYKKTVVYGPTEAQLIVQMEAAAIESAGAGGAAGGCGDIGGAAGQWGSSYVRVNTFDVRPGLPMSRLAIAATTADIAGPRADTVRRCAIALQANGGGADASPYNFRGGPGSMGEKRAYISCALQEYSQPRGGRILVATYNPRDDDPIMQAYQTALTRAFATPSRWTREMTMAIAAWDVASEFFSSGKLGLPSSSMTPPASPTPDAPPAYNWQRGVGYNWQGGGGAGGLGAGGAGVGACGGGNRWRNNGGAAGVVMGRRVPTGWGGAYRR